MAKNIYGEMFEQLPIPERLLPENIAKMLDEQALTATKRSEITVSESSEKVVSKPITHSVRYRAIMSVAACAILVLGLIRFTADDKPAVIATDPTPGEYAENYDELHKTFQQYYVDDEDSNTLDSAIAEIEHAYNESKENSETDEVKEPEITTSATESTEADTTETNPAETATPESEEAPPVDETPDIDEVPDDEEVIEAPDTEKATLPNIDGFDTDSGIYAEGNRIYLREGNTLKVFDISDGLRYEVEISPVLSFGERKTLTEYFVIGDKIALVYNVESAAIDVPAEETEADSTLDSIIGEAYTEAPDVAVKYTTEIKLYQLINGSVFELYTQAQAGRYVDASMSNGSVYIVSDYNSYRTAPIVGVDDLDSYVPTYTVNGEKRYIEANNILIPSKLTTTDYTVISGLNTFDLTGSVQALLGYEGRVVATDEAVYIFGYEADNSTGTAVEIFALENGSVSHRGFTVIDGLALSGDGIAHIGDSIIVTTVGSSANGFTTTVRAYDNSLEILSKIDFPGLFTHIEKDGSKLYVSSDIMAYGIDFADPLAPALIEATGEADVCDRLVPFEDGYLALYEQEGKLILSKLIEDSEGNLSNCCETVVYEGVCTSKALENNALLYAGDGIVGVPYGYFDGLDYCYTYALYKSTATGFELVGGFETHEADTAFEPGKGIELNGDLYVFSDGRVYRMSASAEGLTCTGYADLIYSTYSGHNGF